MHVALVCMMTMASRCLLWSFLLCPFPTTIKLVEGGELCTSPNNVFHVRVDLFSSVMGHYIFQECGNIVNPSLGLKIGENYTFIQDDRTNYFHPFAISSTANLFRQGDEVIDREMYERRFMETANSWSSYPVFSVTVTIESMSALIYQCLVHHGMEGSIRVLPAVSDVNAVLSSEENDVSNSSFEDARSEFDKQCGTYGLEAFQLPNPFCPDHFVCGVEGVNEELQLFARCLDAANCHMMSGMTTGVKATADAALFIHQMIPHHENAVNTAKTLLKTGSLLCPDLADSSNPDCELEGLLLRIVSSQNHEIQLMQDFLSKRKYPQDDNCDVYVKTVDDLKELEGAESAGIFVVSAAVGAHGFSACLLIGTFVLWLVVF